MSDITTLMMAASGGVAGAYEISRSLRFNSADSAYLSRTPASAGNRKTWTWSGWVKRSNLSGATTGLFGAGSASSTDTGIYWTSADKIDFFDRSGGSLQGYISTTAVFRDPSAWYHLVAVFDSANATSTSRMLLYVNNVLQSVTVNNTLPLNTDGAVNNTVGHNLGSLASASNFNNGYMTEVHFIDGQALTPSSFGEINADTGVWSPIAYAGTYGTNGFYLNFSDNSGVTSSTLGKDSSGNNNDWTPNNFSVTAGAGNDSLVDTPTPYGTDTGAGGEVRGNYATLNPLNLPPSNNTVSNGNLENNANVSGQFGAATSTISVSSGKWYAEFTVNAVSGTPSYAVGISTTQFQNERVQPNGYYGNFWYYSYGYAYISDGRKYTNNSDSAYGATYTSGDVIGVALDLDAGTVVFYKNGVSQGTAFSGLSGTFTINTAGLGVNSRTEANFGQRPFAYTAPSGFKALVTTNLPDPTVVQGDEYFNTVLYTGTGSSLGVTGVGFQPDFTWIKERSGAADHGLYDAVRGVQNQLESNTTTAETTEATGLTAFGADGFTVGALAQLNTNTDTYVAWNWKANGAGVSNTDGTITSTVSANQTAGISIVTYNSGASGDKTVGHGLGVAPSMIITKSRTSASFNWAIYHASVATTVKKYLAFTTDALSDNGSNIWGSAFPTTSVFGITSGNGVVASTDCIAYCFAAIPGFSAFGSYTGNGSTDGTFVYTGFRPAFVMFKKTSATSDWTIADNKRTASYNVVNGVLVPNSSAAEQTLVWADFLSNGFKLRQSYDGINVSGQTYIFAAFAENPFKFSLAR